MTTKTTTKPPFAVAKKRVTFVHNQYNSPLELYSADEIAQTLRRHASLLSNGAVGWVTHHDIFFFYCINVKYKLQQ